MPSHRDLLFLFVWLVAGGAILLLASEDEVRGIAPPPPALETLAALAVEEPLRLLDRPDDRGLDALFGQERHDVVGRRQLGERGPIAGRNAVLGPAAVLARVNSAALCSASAAAWDRMAIGS